MNRIDALNEVEFFTSLNNDFNNLKTELTNSFKKFVNAEIKNIFMISEVFMLFDDEQKRKFLSEFLACWCIVRRANPKSVAS